MSPIETTHGHDVCGTCSWLATEAIQTALEAGSDHWTSQTITSGVTHTAHYTREDPTR